MITIQIIFASHDFYDSNKFQTVKNNPNLRSKALGGLWTCPIRPKQKIKNTSWIKWTNFNFKFFTILNLDQNAKVFLIDNFNDLKHLINDFGVRFGHFLLAINFEELSRKYDAIYLTKNGIREANTPNLLYSLCEWDVETVFVMNKNIISIEKIIKRENIYE